MSGGPSHIDLFDYKPKLKRVSRPGAARVGPHGPADHRHDVRPEVVSLRRADVQVRASTAKSGTWISELLPHTAGDRRRHRHHQVGEHRGDQPRPGHHLHPDRRAAAGPAQPGRLAQLRPGERESEPAGVRRADLARQRQQDRSAALLAALGQRLPADASIRACASARATIRCSICRTRPASTAATRRRMLDGLGQLEPAGGRVVRRSGNQHPHRAIRDGLPHADLRARADRPVGRAAGARSTCTASTITASTAASPATACWPGGWSSAACGSCSFMHRGWDQHSNLPEPDSRAMQGRRPADRRPGQGPQAARPAGRHAGRSGAANSAAPSTARAR